MSGVPGTAGAVVYRGFCSIWSGGESGREAGAGGGSGSVAERGVGMRRKSQQASVPGRKRLNEMTSEEVRAWIGQTRERLLRKMQRERAYLDRRARRGVR